MTFCDIRWPGLMQVGRVTRIRTDKRRGKTSIERVCFITSIPQSHSTPEQLLALNRGHWAIENSLHWVKDTVFCEDASTLRTNSAPRIASALRSFALFLLKQNGFTPTLGREFFALNPHSAINATKIT